MLAASLKVQQNPPSSRDRVIYPMEENIAVDRSAWKIAVISIATALAGAWLGYAISNELSLIGLIAATVFALLFLMQSLMMHSGRLIGVVVAAQGAGLLGVSFWDVGMTNATLLGGLVTIGVLMLASWRGQNYTARTLAISARDAGSVVTPLTMTAIALVATIAIVGTLSANGLAISRSALEGFLKPGEWIVQRFAPGFALDGTLSNFVRTNSELILKGELAVVPKAQQEEAISGALLQIQSTIRDTFAINARANDTMIDIIERIINVQLKKIPDDFRVPVWLGVGVLIWLTIKGFGSLLGGIVNIAAAAFFQLLLLIGFIRTGLESRQKEVVVL